MNFQNIVNEIAKADPEVFERTSDRRRALRNFGRGVALTALPFALGSLFNKAYGKGNAVTILEVLNYALTLEHLEAAFYKQANDVSGTLIPVADRAAFITIAGHEKAHVNFLKNTISTMGGTPVAEATYDFNAGSTFSDVFTNYDTFLAVAQTFEDTGVRAYKGAAGDLMSNNDVLTAALRIHSVEARHAAHVRQLRHDKIVNGIVDLKPWITGNISGITNPAAAVQPSYNGEESTMQAGIEIVNINNTGITFNAASEAFDEPLSMDAVKAIVAPFIVS